MFIGLERTSSYYVDNGLQVQSRHINTQLPYGVKCVFIYHHMSFSGILLSFLLRMHTPYSYEHIMSQWYKDKEQFAHVKTLDRSNPYF